MARSQVQYGSQGNDVKELQKILNQNGYKLTEDGIFGTNTQNAVKDYQKKYGLTVDGIVGNNTWASLTKGNTSSNSFKYDDFKHDDFSYGKYQESDAVKQAQNALNAQLAQKPGEYQSQWHTQLNDVINKIMNREKFSYDLNGDALYQQYKDKYIQQGKMAMGDAIGQASAMTGGYGNSYAQSVGQQAYQAQLNNLNDIVPELYQMAYDKYNQEGQDLYNQYSMLGTQEEQDYGRYRDSVADWLTERDYLANRYDSERGFDYSKYTNDRDFAYNQYADDRNFAYGKYADDKSYAYNEYRNAIADEQWEKEFAEAQRQFDEQMALKNSSGSDSPGGNDESNGGSGKGTTESGVSYDNGSLTTEQVKALQNAIGANADGYYGANSKAAAGGLSAEEAYKKYVGGNIEPIKAVNSQSVSLFKSAVRTRSEFGRADNPDKQKYGTYNKYLEGMIDSWLRSGKLNSDEAATLIAYYSLA